MMRLVPVKFFGTRSVFGAVLLQTFRELIG
jgi:hypothetical protein